MNNAVEYSDVNNFADDTNNLYSSKSLKDINRKINFDLKNIVMWQRANKILLNAGKTELVLFKSKKRKITKNMNFGISRHEIKMLSK